MKSDRSLEALVEVRFMDHTADVGVEVEAPSLELLIEGAAMGMTRLILGDDRPREEEERTIRAEGTDPALLLRNVLRELLFLHEARGFALALCRVEFLAPEEMPAGGESVLRVRCRVTGGRDPGPPDRELKGVTLHGLIAERREGKEGRPWFGRVIFDV